VSSLLTTNKNIKTRLATRRKKNKDDYKRKYNYLRDKVKSLEMGTPRPRWEKFHFLNTDQILSDFASFEKVISDFLTESRRTRSADTTLVANLMTLILEECNNKMKYSLGSEFMLPKIISLMKSVIGAFIFLHQGSRDEFDNDKSSAGRDLYKSLQHDFSKENCMRKHYCNGMPMSKINDMIQTKQIFLLRSVCN